MGDKYLLNIQNGRANLNAGYKAPADVRTILTRNGWREYTVLTDDQSPVASFLSLLCHFIYLPFYFHRNSTILIQYPVRSKKGFLLLNYLRLFFPIKDISTIALIHDIEYLRNGGAGTEQEISELNRYDTLVVHSERMKRALLKDGCKSNIVILGLFDYLVESEYVGQRTAQNDVCYVGNLSNRNFLNELSSVLEDSSVRFHIYGQPAFSATSDTVLYQGVFAPSDVSGLVGSWGLVWDGDSVYEPSGLGAEYQRFNSPHKASLYIVAHLPLIVHSSSAISSIVRENNIGIVIDSLVCLEEKLVSISRQEYEKILQNVTCYAERLVKGKNLLEVLT